MPDDASEYDVIIIGGGPAGSTAGFLLSNLGFSVLIIDRSTFPRRKLCGGLITHKTLTLLDRIFGETESSLRRKNILNFCSNQFEIFYKDKLLVKDASELPFYFVDRYTYDHFLLKKAQQAGAKLIEGESVTAFDFHKSEVMTSTGRILNGKFVIGADGVNSIIRRSFPKEQIDQRKWQHDLATALEIFVARNEMRKAVDHPVLFFGFVDWGYSWIFPNKDKLVVGLGGLNRINKKRFLNSFHDFLSVLGIEGRRTSKINAHPVPYGNFLLMPVCRGAVLIGDAAGFVDPLLGEGIFYAQRSAELASRAIHETMCRGEKLEVTYLKLLRKYVYPELVYAKKIRWFTFNAFGNLHYYPMKILLNATKKTFIQLVHGIRTYKWLRKKGVVHETIQF